MGVILRAHSIHGESHIQRHTNWEVATLYKIKTIILLKQPISLQLVRDTVNTQDKQG